MLKLIEQVSPAITDPDDPILPGVAPERVDSQTLRIVEQLFPAQKGIEFLALLLHHALVKQTSLPGMDRPADCAVVAVQSLRVLSKMIGWSYDTTEKYVVLFCKLQLLSKERHRSQIRLHFPLSPYQLPSPETLDNLDYRPKVLQFARMIRKRLVVLRQGKVVRSSPTPVATLTTLPGQLCQDIRAIIEQEKVDSGVAGRLLGKIERAVHYRCALSAGRLLEESGDSDEDCESGESPSSTEKGDFLPPPSSEKRRLSEQMVDSALMQTIRKGPLSEQMVDSEDSGVVEKSTASIQKGDFSPVASSKKTTLSSQKGDSAEENLPNVNVITIINTITLNVSTGALFCCRALKEPSSKQGIYRKLFHEVACDVHAITAALIYTLVHREDGTMHKPPAIFYQRCKEYHRNGIPEEAALLVQQYGSLTYKQLMDSLRQKVSPHQHHTSFQGSVVAPARPLPPPVQRRQWKAHTPYREDLLPGMREADLEHVERLLRHHRLTQGIPTRRYKRPDGSYVLLLDDGLVNSHQRWLYSLNECQNALASIQRTQEFFLEPRDRNTVTTERSSTHQQRRG